MRYLFYLLIMIVVALAAYRCAYAVETDKDGCVKFSFDSLPFLGSSGKDCDGEQGYEAAECEPDEYTYDAMGRKVPVRTLRSGDASPVR